jgi:acetolactate synthase I/III small subunit
MKHTLLARVADQPGVLNRVASMFRRRAFNIDSLTVGASEADGFSRMTIVVDATRTSAHLVATNLAKLVPVEDVRDVTAMPLIARDLALVRVRCRPEERGALHELVSGFRARVADVSPGEVIVETTGTEEDVTDLVELLRPRGVLEVVRTGRVVMVRGEKDNAPDAAQAS